eukprot:4632066-Prymnesium_polylepis.1
MGEEICPPESRNREKKFARVARKKIAKANRGPLGTVGDHWGPDRWGPLGTLGRHWGPLGTAGDPATQRDTCQA